MEESEEVSENISPYLANWLSATPAKFSVPRERKRDRLECSDSLLAVVRDAWGESPSFEIHDLTPQGPVLAFESKVHPGFLVLGCNSQVVIAHADHNLIFYKKEEGLYVPNSINVANVIHLGEYYAYEFIVSNYLYVASEDEVLLWSIEACSLVRSVAVEGKLFLGDFCFCIEKDGWVSVTRGEDDLEIHLDSSLQGFYANEFFCVFHCKGEEETRLSAYNYSGEVTWMTHTQEDVSCIQLISDWGLCYYEGDRVTIFNSFSGFKTCLELEVCCPRVLNEKYLSYVDFENHLILWDMQTEEIINSTPIGCPAFLKKMSLDWVIYLGENEYVCCYYGVNSDEEVEENEK